MLFRYIIFILLIIFPAVSQAHAIYKYDLDVSIDVEKSQLTGLSRIRTDDSSETYINKGSLTIQEITVNGEKTDFIENNNIIRILHSPGEVIEIVFEAVFKDDKQTEHEYSTSENIIGKRGVSLINVWYPVTDGLNLYTLHAVFPEGYEALAEAENITKDERGKFVEFTFEFSHPLDRINLVASDRFEIIQDRYRDIDIFAYFFREDIDLAGKYLEFTKKYLRMYEDMVGKYPYSRFSIVENFEPTGYSMPTYTLLGSSVIKLPFIVETALGHEILHQWFGNNVYVDYQSGNWSEGLTAYLSDHLYREQKGEGWQYRKQILVDYKSYVNSDNETSLRDFTSRVDYASRTIGYGKTAMVFHMLKNLLGEDVFFGSLKEFIHGNRFNIASWDDLKKSFESKSGRDLGWFFDQWVNGKGLPVVEFNDLSVLQKGGQFEMGLTVNQKEKIFALEIPVTVYLPDAKIRTFLTLNKKRNSFEIPLPDRPIKIVYDENYDVARMIEDTEYPAVIAGLIGEDPVVLVLPDKEDGTYTKIIERFKQKNSIVKEAGDTKLSDLKSESAILLGADNRVVKRLFGSLDLSDAGFSVTVMRNPLNTKKFIGIMDGKNREEVDLAFRKIFHYGKYSHLKFNKGENTDKTIEPTRRGIIMEMNEEIPAIDISGMQNLSDVIEGVKDKKIVYVGEVHDVFAHHAVQLDVIRGIHKRDGKLAIGMEMFQRPFQKALDTFVAGRMGERDFLKKSEYFKRWGFDYNLYKPILDFARTENIPIIALNMEREIIEMVSEGGLDSLADEERDAVPQEMDLSDKEYRERLLEIFELHEKKEGRNFDNFYQSQILWDETMSESIDRFLKNKPDYQIAVLAGQGHLRYGSGIPRRTYRRNGYDYAIVLIDDDVEKGIADFVVFPKPVEGVTAPKLMTYLKKEESGFLIAAFPEDSVSETAGLMVGDIITFIDDVKTVTLEDIKIHLLYKRKGDVVRIKVLREEEGEAKEIGIDVTL